MRQMLTGVIQDLLHFPKSQGFQQEQNPGNGFSAEAVVPCHPRGQMALHNSLGQPQRNFIPRNLKSFKLESAALRSLGAPALKPALRGTGLEH